MTRIIAAVTLLAFLSACGGWRDSRVNPMNWFGRDREDRIAVTEADAVVDPRGLVSQVLSLKVERIPGGAIIHAMGLPPTQGYWAAELVPLNAETPDKGTLTYEFRLANPVTPWPEGTQRSREVLVGHFVSDDGLAGVRRITVIGQANRRTVNR
jgi:hypothetical protein